MLPEKFAVENTIEVMQVKRSQKMTNLPFGFKGTKYAVFPKNEGFNGGTGLSHFSDVVPEGFNLISVEEFFEKYESCH
jgi:hypothetical protein